MLINLVESASSMMKGGTPMKKMLLINIYNTFFNQNKTSVLGLAFWENLF